MPARPLVLTLALPLVLGLASCADGGERDPSAAAPTGTASAPAGVVHEYATMAEEIEAEGGQTTAGDWRVAYIVEGAEPWFQTEAGKQVFRPVARGETHHIEILPFEARTGRLVPDVPVTLEVVDAAGRVVQAKPLRFLHGEFFHYAANFSIPRPGTYTLRATIGVPTFSRHGEQTETPTLTRGATVTFPGVTLERA